MKNSFFAKILVFGLITCFFACKTKDQNPNPLDCKIVSFNFATLEINAQNQITGLNSGASRISSYEYDNEGKIIKHNFFASNVQVSSYFDFIWTTNTITQKKFYRNSQGVFTQQGEIVFELDAQKRIFKVNTSNTEYNRYEYNSDGNVIKCYKKDININNGVEFLTVEYTKFDNKLNPYIKQTPLSIYMIDSVGEGFHQSRNNATEAKYYSPNGTSYITRQYSHQYNSSGLPTIIYSSSGNILYFGYNCP
ncbi:MAG: hypothetical protein EAZ85_12200 [Bacteroidetes bacterium]|nr:MAG: hypothetical protein EAZ85_12200 [Bacteroidota bacterium]TAG85893.1 MAG: hypothetical protein EAZ20_13925 [Bacteroidota bacterium]